MYSTNSIKAEWGAPFLSILTPAIPERLSLVNALAHEIEQQRAEAGIKPAEVEHLVFCDTRGARTVGEKRDALLRLARGHYVAFVDDDDLILPQYVASLVAAIRSHAPDCITFRQRVTYCGMHGVVSFGAGNPNEALKHAPEVTLRSPWHVCAFRRFIATLHAFPASNYGEDFAWARHVAADCRTATHIDAELHHYIHDPATTAAPPPK